MNSQIIIDSLATKTAIFIVYIPLYVAALAIACKYPDYKWEIVIGFVYYMILCAIRDKEQ